MPGRALCDRVVPDRGHAGPGTAGDPRGGKHRPADAHLPRYLQGKEDGLAVAFSGEWIYRSTLPREVPALPPDTGHGQERLVCLEDGTPPVLWVYGSLPAPWQDYGLLYMGNLDEAVSTWRHTKNILFLAGALVMPVMAFFLFSS